jgi:hypothetical protein
MIGHGAGLYYGLFSPKQVTDELAADNAESVHDFGCRRFPLPTVRQ